MNVAELIDILKRQDPEALVVVDGYEAGLDDEIRVTAQGIELNAHADEYWNGRHKLANENTPVGKHVQAVWIHGNRRDDK